MTVPESEIVDELNQLEDWKTLFKDYKEFPNINKSKFFKQINEFKKQKDNFKFLNNLRTSDSYQNYLLSDYLIISKFIDNIDNTVSEFNKLNPDNFTKEEFLNYLNEDNPDKHQYVDDVCSKIEKLDKLQYLDCVSYYNEDLKKNMDNLKDIKKLFEDIDQEITSIQDLNKSFGEFQNYFSEKSEKPSKYKSFGNRIIELKYLDILPYCGDNLENIVNEANDLVIIFNGIDDEQKKVSDINSQIDKFYKDFDSLIDEDLNEKVKQSFLQDNSNLIQDINSFKYLNFLENSENILKAKEFLENFDNEWAKLVDKHNMLEEILSYKDTFIKFNEYWNDFSSKFIHPQDFDFFIDKWDNLKDTVDSFSWPDTQRDDYAEAIELAKNIKFKFENINDYISVINAKISINEFLNICENKYLGSREKNELFDKYNKYYNDLDSLILLSEKLDISLDNKEKFENIFDNYLESIDSGNKKFVSNELINYGSFFDNIDGKSLDKNQREAIVIDEDNMQIIAGAGCGKTLTILGKVMYLIKKGIKPEDILCLSYSGASADDLVRKLPNNVKASTFHSLGKGILEENLGGEVDVADNLLDDIINDFFRNDLFENTEILEKVMDYFLYYSYDVVDRENKNLGEILEIEEGRYFKTLRERYSQFDEKRTFNDNKKVRSFEELIIANFLFIHGINYEYEKQYTDNDGNKVKLPYRYKPDFYLPDYKIYIEHFGVNENHDAPWLDKKDSDDYKEKMQSKIELHKEIGTKLIKTYSYFASNNILIYELRKRLEEEGVEIKDVNYEEILKVLAINDKINSFKPLITLIKSFISLFKGNNYDSSKFNKFILEAKKENLPFIKQRHLLFLDIVQEIFTRYENALDGPDKIDFDDMINDATELIAQKKVSRNYKYIIVDEYQDISYSRFNLLKTIQDFTGAKLYVVGDDWQSIYRFSGCDVSLFTDFDKHFLDYKRCRIIKTYRNSQSLLNIAYNFITKNPNQLDKKLKSEQSDIKKPIKVAFYKNRSNFSKIEALEKCIMDISKTSKNILILGRYNRSINPYIGLTQDYKVDGNLINYTPFEGKNNPKNKEPLKINYKKDSSLNITFLTAHSSKGLEEDNVVILDLENDYLGFPSKKEDDSVLKYVINEKDNFELSEERRLFYVAITRTKKYNYFLVNEEKPSEFVEELREFTDFDVINHIEHDYANEKIIRTTLRCPICKTGYVSILNHSQYFRKFICSHDACEWDGGHYYGKFKDLDIMKPCSCGGIEYIAYGKNGPFDTCSNYKTTGCKGENSLEGKFDHLIEEYNKSNNKKGKEEERINKEKEEYNKNNSHTNSKNKVLCPECGSGLVKRNGEYGEFMGCKSFPKCKFTCNIDELDKYCN